MEEPTEHVPRRRLFSGDPVPPDTRTLKEKAAQGLKFAIGYTIAFGIYHYFTN